MDFNGADVEPRAKFEIFRKTSLSISNCNINCGIRIYGFHLSHHLNYCRLHLSSGSAWSFRSFICLKIFALFEAAYGSVFVSTNVLDGTVETALLALLLLLSAADDDDDAAAAIMPSHIYNTSSYKASTSSHTTLHVHTLTLFTTTTSLYPTTSPSHNPSTTYFNTSSYLHTFLSPPSYKHTLYSHTSPYASLLTTNFFSLSHHFTLYTY